MGCGDCDDADQNLVIPAKLLQLRNMQDRLAALQCPHDALIHIEGRRNVQAVFCKADIVQQRLAQLAAADDHRRIGIIIAKKLLDIVNQRFAVVADLGPPAVGDQRQILSHLHLAHI